jgi:hypothetical protein
MIVVLTKKSGTEYVSAEVRQITNKKSVVLMYRAFDDAHLHNVTLSYNEESKIYEDENFFVDADVIYNIVAPHKTVRVKKPRGYWAVDKCAGGACKK